MGLINMPNLEDGFTASANIFNERFGRIVDELNGNLDAQNLKNEAVTREKIAPGAITSDKMDIDRYVDANGWTVFDLGGIKTYSREFVTSGVHNLAEGQRVGMAVFDPPEGKTRESVSIVTTWYGGYSGHVLLGIEDNGPTQMTLHIAHNWPYPLVMNGRAILIATDRLI